MQIWFTPNILGNKIKIFGATIIALLFGFAILSGCEQKTQNEPKVKGSGILTGTVSIGPLCPVESVPPDPSCLPTEKTFKAYPIAVFSVDHSKWIDRIKPKAPQGIYTIELPVGTYQLDLDLESPGGIGSSNLPRIVTIEVDKTSSFDIKIDTGIR